jgi:hypothetical protein
MRNYWSCSPVADWIRGTAKPQWGTGEEWQDWKIYAKQQYPIRYWIAEEGLDMLQNFLRWPIKRLHSIRYYINNRFITRTHCLTAHPRDIGRGKWMDVGNRFLPCLFNELVDFVEVEQAWHNVMWDEEALKKFKPAWYRRWFNFRGWRSRESGLAYLDWASNLKMDETWGLSPGDKDYGKLTPQAKYAREIKALYLWWTEVYPNRPDPYDASGWTEICEKIRVANGGDLFIECKDLKLKKQQDRAHKLLHKIEQEYEKEDEAMLIRLIKVRHSLWT